MYGRLVYRCVLCVWESVRAGVCVNVECGCVGGLGLLCEVESPLVGVVWWFVVVFVCVWVLLMHALLCTQIVLYTLNVCAGVLGFRVYHGVFNNVSADVCGE